MYAYRFEKVTINGEIQPILFLGPVFTPNKGDRMDESSLTDDKTDGGVMWDHWPFSWFQLGWFILSINFRPKTRFVRQPISMRNRSLDQEPEETQTLGHYQSCGEHAFLPQLSLFKWCDSWPSFRIGPLQLIDNTRLFRVATGTAYVPSPVGVSRAWSHEINLRLLVNAINAPKCINITTENGSACTIKC